jgi:hypothetical protein
MIPRLNRFTLRLVFAVGLAVSTGLVTGSAAGHVVDAATSGCTVNAPGVTIDNTWAWGATGSWGLPGQQLAFKIDVTNYDVGCASATFVISFSAPGGFASSVPATSITLKPSAWGYLWAYVTSPATATDGDYPLSVTVQRAGTTAPVVTYTSYYKVYSTDTVAPTLYWPSPGDGTTISSGKGKATYNVMVSSNDDHVVRKIELDMDNVYTTTTTCDPTSYDCQLAYKWSMVKGQHTATFKSYDWVGNVAVLTVHFTVS